MSQCPHGERVRREGVSAKGPWVGHFCPLKKGDPNQCKPEFERKAKGEQPDGFYPKTIPVQEKNDIITNLAIIKELIGAGRKYGVDVVKEFYQWKNLAEGKTVKIENNESEVPF